MASQKKKIVLLGRLDRPTAILYNSLCAGGLTPGRVIVEEGEPKLTFLKRRIKRLGLVKVAGQIAFRCTVVPWLKLSSRRRVRQIVHRFGLDSSPIPRASLTFVKSVNSEGCLQALRELGADVIVVSGTRIISDRVLSSNSATFINMHAGMTPMYRGSHGGYWSLVQGDRDGCGVTVHQLDAGVDTGPILGQARISPQREDNFVTYGLLQQAVGLPLLKEAIRHACEGRLDAVASPLGASKLWTHPTLSEYIHNRLSVGVK
jgi:folate-dependent phosphoribosylglycinamide formyltransferase PurN